MKQFLRDPMTQTIFTIIGVIVAIIATPSLYAWLFPTHQSSSLTVQKRSASPAQMLPSIPTPLQTAIATSGSENLQPPDTAVISCSAERQSFDAKGNIAPNNWIVTKSYGYVGPTHETHPSTISPSACTDGQYEQVITPTKSTATWWGNYHEKIPDGATSLTLWAYIPLEHANASAIYTINFFRFDKTLIDYAPLWLLNQQIKKQWQHDSESLTIPSDAYSLQIVLSSNDQQPGNALAASAVATQFQM